MSLSIDGQLTVFVHADTVAWFQCTSFFVVERGFPFVNPELVVAPSILVICQSSSGGRERPAASAAFLSGRGE
jgi:hypothetical protein